MNSEQVLEFVNQNKLEITEHCKKGRCVDGRYDAEGNEKEFALIAKPGGDAGDIVTALAALNSLEIDIPVEQVVEVVVENVGGAENFCFHTDDHAEHDKLPSGMGCGHLKLAKNNPDQYGVNQEQMDELFEILPELMQDGADQVVLHGDHEEQAVVVVESDSHGLKPLQKDGDTITEVFVYQKSLHEEQMKTLAALLVDRFPEEITVSSKKLLVALLDSFEVQLTETVQALASELPLFTAKIDKTGKVIVS